MLLTAEKISLASDAKVGARDLEPIRGVAEDLETFQRIFSGICDHNAVALGRPATDTSS